MVGDGPFHREVDQAVLFVLRLIVMFDFPPAGFFNGVIALVPMFAGSVSRAFSFNTSCQRYFLSTQFYWRRYLPEYFSVIPIQNFRTGMSKPPTSPVFYWHVRWVLDGPGPRA